jgi:hypothetical protein
MSIRTGSFDLRTLILATAASCAVHFGLTGRAFGAEPAQNEPAAERPMALVPVVLPPLSVTVHQATIAGLRATWLFEQYRGSSLLDRTIRYCPPGQGRGVWISGERDERTGELLPDRLRCNL